MKMKRYAENVRKTALKNRVINKSRDLYKGFKKGGIPRPKLKKNRIK